MANNNNHHHDRADGTNRDPKVDMGTTKKGDDKSSGVAIGKGELKMSTFVDGDGNLKNGWGPNAIATDSNKKDSGPKME